MASRPLRSPVVLLTVLSLGIAGIAVWLLLNGSGRCVPGDRTLAAYEWRTTAWATPADATDLISAAEDLCLTTVYVDVTGLAVDEVRDDVSASLMVLLEHAGDSDIRVGALAGDPWWSTPQGTVDARLVIHSVAEVNRSVEPADRLVALHLDVEPWGLASWSSDRSALAEQYIRFVNDAVGARNEQPGEPLALGFLVPYWFDGSNGEAPLISMGGATNYPFQHLAAGGNEDVTWLVMAYRDRAFGTGGILDLLETEIGSSAPVGLVVETAPVEPSTVTFADEDIAHLDRELTAVVDGLADDGTAVLEVVINDLEHLRALAHTEP